MGFGKQSPSAREPATYQILRARQHITLDSQQTDKRLIRRIQNGNAAVQAIADAASGFDVADYKFYGFGIRIYDNKFAFACRDDRKIEIQTLKVRNRIVVNFTNYDRRIVGLLRIEVAGSYKELLSKFLGAADRRTRSGDRTKLEIYVGAPVEDEAQVANLLRRSEVARTVDGIMRSAITHATHLHPFPDRDSSVRWISAFDFNLRVDTGSGKVSIETGDLGS